MSADRIDIEQLREGIRLDTAAKIDFFEEITALAFRSGARDRLEAWTFVLDRGEGDLLPLLQAGGAQGLQVPFEVALGQAADAVASGAPGSIRDLQSALATALRERGIHAIALSAEEGTADARERLLLVRETRGTQGRVIEGEWRWP